MTPIDPTERITTAHGAGGIASRRLIDEVCLPRIGGPALTALGDAGLVDTAGIEPGRPLAMTTDAFVVTPLRFAGGSIGSLAIHGTVNDLAVSGARPVALTVAFVLEEGLEMGVLAGELDAMAAAARECGVEIVGADTKVLPRGGADRMFVTTTGLGVVVADPVPAPTALRAGDRVLLSGPVADHGIAVMLARGELKLSADVRSDSAPLWPAVSALLDACPAGLRAMRDATRGGVATVLNEFAAAAGLGIEIEEAAVPLNDPTRGACELLGLDPLFVANEGCMIVVVAPEDTETALAALRSTEVGRRATAIGEVTGDVGADSRRRVVARTVFGGKRIIDMLVGDPLPRIC